MKTILSKVKLKSRQIILLFVLVLLSAVGQMLLPSFLAQMISHGVAEGENRIILMYAAIMAGVTVFSCIISFLSVKIALSVIPIIMVPLSLLSAAGVMKASEKYYGEQQEL